MQNRLLTLPLASTCSAANTTPPQRGHPCPGLALIEVVSMTGARDVLTSLNNTTEDRNSFNCDRYKWKTVSFLCGQTVYDAH